MSDYTAIYICRECGAFHTIPSDTLKAVVFNLNMGSGCCRDDLAESLSEQIEQELEDDGNGQW